MLKARFSTKAHEDLHRLAGNPRLLDKINRLILDACAHPFTGLGKPEPLKHRLQGHWSRRIDAKNRLVYRVVRPDLIVISVIGHYE
jgi:toxin YoeB